MNAVDESALRIHRRRKRKELIDAIDAVLAWWDKHKDDTYTYSIGDYGYDGEMFDSGAVAVFERLREAKDENDG